MARRTRTALRTQTSEERLVRLSSNDAAALRAWADLDRFEIVDVPTDDEKGRLAVGRLSLDALAGDWPSRPANPPDDRTRLILATRVFVNCRPLAKLEALLETVFAADIGFAQTGLRPPRDPAHPGSGRESMTCRASFLLDPEGRPLADSMSFAPLIDFAKYLHFHRKERALPHLIREGLGKLDDFEEKIHEKWQRASEKSGHLSPVDALCLYLEALSDDSDDPHRYLAVWVRPENEPPGQLPAFYRADLLAAADTATSSLLRDYMRGRPAATPTDAHNVRKPLTTGQALVEPSRLPRASWPSGYLPRLSQQVALGGLLNHPQRITAVNGPPGTGKTTLLREVYANVVSDRALVLADFDDPRTAFGDPVAVPGTGTREWKYRIVSDRVTGFEMLVASSNNAAVQNVSKELPALSGIGQQYREEITYFRPATEPGPPLAASKPNVQQGGRKPKRRPGLLEEGTPAWGFAAAVLGSRDRVGRFSEVTGRFVKGPGSHLLGQLRGGDSLDQWEEARAAYGAAVKAVDDNLNDLEEQRSRLGAGGTRRLRRYFLGSTAPTRPVDFRTFADDQAWWDRPERDRELGTAWVDEHLQRLRAELFIAAMRVHEAFARRAGEALADNLRLWLALQSGEVDRRHVARATIHAWRSFFLLVPLASTTFASMSRLLAHVPPGSLGWLIVDEAGQATPGSAAGGLARFRRALVVGDPLQLEPVVTLPRLLVEQLVQNQGAPENLAPHRASVQALADSVTPLGTVRQSAWVGLPLLVHNRCQDPMFSIANTMAYSGDMVQGRVRGDAEGVGVLGVSRWIDVRHPPGDHYFLGDAEVVHRLLGQLMWGTADPVPSIAVISPFRKVVHALSPLIQRQVRQSLPRDLSKEAVDAVFSRIGVGTVHTFQGREYDVVILVLGGGSPGARHWAASTPNLLNVAVTRAKDRLFVIGDHSAWADVGHARVLANVLPVITD